jgi:hypothetical protein
LFASSHSAGRHSKLLPQMHSVCASRPCCILSRCGSSTVRVSHERLLHRRYNPAVDLLSAFQQ